MAETTEIRLLFVMNSLAVGGPQRSTIAFIRRLNPKKYNVTVLLLNGHRADLQSLLPAHVTLLYAPSQVRAVLLESERGVAAFDHYRKAFGIIDLTKVCIDAVTQVLGRKGMNRVRQKAWSRHCSQLPMIPGRYDVAVGILGMSSYVVTDLVQARSKFHWIRSDVEILQRDHACDANIYARMDGAIAVSEETAHIFKQRFPFMDGRVEVYKNDLLSIAEDEMENCADFKESHDQPIIATVSRLDRLKGLDLALEAAAILQERGSQFTWLVLGDGPMRDTLEATIRRNGLSNSIHLLGFVDNPTRILSQATAYVHPSRTEGRSNAVEEAKALGLPVICTNFSTASSHITHGRSGLICEMNAISLANTITDLLHDESLQESLGVEARREHESERDDPERLIGQLMAYIESR